MLLMNLVLRSLTIAIVAIGCAERSRIAKADEDDISVVIGQSIPPGTDTAVARRRMAAGGFACQRWAAVPVDEAPGPTVRFLRCARAEPLADLPDRALRVSLAYTGDKIDSVLLAPLPQAREVEVPHN